MANSMGRKCSLWWCDRPYYAKGYCHTHCTALRRYGSPYGKHAVEMSKIQARIDNLQFMLDRTTELLNRLVTR